MRLHNFRFLALALFLLLPPTAMALAQDPMVPPEGVTPDSDWLYGKHLEQVNAIMQEKDLAVRVQKLENFTKKLDPKTKILPYMEGFFTQTADEYKQAGKTAESDAVLAKVAQLFPNSPTLKQQAFLAAVQKQDWPKVLELGEPIYAQTPTPELTVTLAQAAIQSQNAPKALEYSQKAAEALGPEKGLYFVGWLGDYYASQKDTAKALEYYEKVLAAAPGDAPPAGWQPQQWNARKGGILLFKGDLAYAAKDCPGSIQQYTEAIKYFPQADAAYFKMGMCHWRAQELDKAEANFAKVVVMNKPASAKAREYLEQIWKPRHNNSLEGLDALLAKAKEEVKM